MTGDGDGWADAVDRAGVHWDTITAADREALQWAAIHSIAAAAILRSSSLPGPTVRRGA